MRAREAAKQDQLRARHRLTKFLLRTGGALLGVKAWTARYVTWLEQSTAQLTREATLKSCLHEVRHMSRRVQRLEPAIVEVMKAAPQPMQELIRGSIGIAWCGPHLGGDDCRRIGESHLPVRKRAETDGLLRGIPSEDSSGKRKRKGSLTKAGNAHLRRIVIRIGLELSWPSAIDLVLDYQRQEGVPVKSKKVAKWKAQNRLHKRYVKMVMAGKEQRKIITAIGRESCWVLFT